MIETKCILCGSNSNSFLSKAIKIGEQTKLLRVYRCQKCNLVFVYPPLTKDEAKLFYKNSFYSRDTTGYYTKEGIKNKIKRSIYRYHFRNKNILGYLLYFVFKNYTRNFPSNKFSRNILDVGCWGGEFLYFTKSTGKYCIGLEYNFPTCKNIKNIISVVCCADATNMPFKDKSIDCVRVNHVVEHLSNPEIALKEAFRVLKPKGELIVAVPNSSGGYLYAEKSNDIFISFIPEHLLYFDEKSLKKIIEKCSFKNIKIEYYSDIYFFIASKLRFLKKLRGIIIPNFSIGGHIIKTFNVADELIAKAIKD